MVVPKIGATKGCYTVSRDRSGPEPASTYDADTAAFAVVAAAPTRWTAGGTHEPFSADSCGQYIRKMRWNPFDGAGSQLNPLSGPGFG